MRLKGWLIIIFAGLVVVAVVFDRFYVSSRSHSGVSEHVTDILGTESWREIPETVLTTADGREIRLDQYAGKVVILNFWATWCPSCKIEFSTLLKLIRHFDGKVVLVALSADRERSAMENFLESLRSEFSREFDSGNVVVPWDPNRRIIGDVFQTERFPEAIILSKDGRMTRKIIGSFDWDGEQIRAFITRILDM